ALSLALMAIAYQARGSRGSLAPVGRFDVLERLARACFGLWFYPYQTLVPKDLTAFDLIPEPFRWAEPRFLLAIAAPALVALALVRGGRRVPAVSAVALTYAIVLAPNLGLVAFGRWIAADRYSYLASIAPFALLAAGLARLSRARGAAFGVAA